MDRYILELLLDDQVNYFDNLTDQSLYFQMELFLMQALDFRTILRQYQPE